MADNLTLDLLENSVTADDASEYKGRGVVTFLIPWMMGMANMPLPADLPPYWTVNTNISRYWSRDMVLRSTILHEDFWAGALFKATTKQSAKSFEVKGRGADRYQDMLLQWGGDGYVPSMQRGLMDFLCTNNGTFWEIVRQSNAAGSRILGLVHLDALRCIRTGDPETPVVFTDLKGAYHDLKYWQVIAMVDQPDPSTFSIGLGHCAAERAYHQIYKLSAVETYYREKITGTGANNLHLISGMNEKQIQKMLDDARALADSQGKTYYQGNILQGLLAQVEPKLLSIPLRNLPDGFDRNAELEIAQLAYATAIGIDVQDINPRLMARGAMGIGAQASILDEKQHSVGLAAYDKQLTQELNQKVLPGAVTFAFNERDLRDEQNRAQVQLLREQTLNSKVTNGQLTPSQALQMSIEADDVPREFMPTGTPADQDQPLSDEEKPIDQGLQGTQGTTPPATAPQPSKPGAAQPNAPTEQAIKVKEQTIIALLNEIKLTREALANA